MRTASSPALEDALESALALEREGFPDEALLAYDRLLAKRSPPPEAFRRKADLLLRIGRHAQALECYEIAQSHGLYGDADVATGKGACLLRLGRLHEALGCFERSSLLRRDAATFALHAECLHRLGRDREAVELRVRAMELDADGRGVSRADEMTRE